ncbi:unnamed protein product [Calicophoron daubneyi]|uniref:Adenylate kinase n=1 Tax=Calicophoron daubneyi TaxID=300641 RepID=A0AAV2T7R6_CALDB
MISQISENVKPIQIPASYVQYAEKHSIFEMTQKLLKNLIIDRPDDPLTYLIDYLDKESEDRPPIFIMGPVSSGKRTLAQLLSEKLNYVVITAADVCSLCPGDKTASPKQLAQLLKKRLKEPDCESRGYILVGFPRFETEAKALRWEGIYPDYAIFLDVPTQTLIERTLGKRVDPFTGIMYHVVTNPPPTVEIEARLLPLPDNTESVIREEIEAYQRETVLLHQIYKPVARDFNADRPITDTYNYLVAHVNQPPRNLALRTPRIILLGFAGSGKTTQADLLSKKYGLIAVHCGDLIKREIANHSSLGRAMKSYAEREMAVPDAIVAEVVKSRLTQADCATKGWVLHGYPRSRQQAEILDSEGLQPNRVMVLDIAQVCAAERLTGRRIDPVTGVRYHLAFKPKEDVQISERALQHPLDRECAVGSKLARYAAHRNELFDHYAPILVHVDATVDAHTVFEQIEAGLVNPLPRVRD